MDAPTYQRAAARKTTRTMSHRRLRIRSPDCLSVHVEIPASGGRRGERGHRVPTPLPAPCGTLIVQVEQAVERGRERRGVIRWHEEAGALMLHDVRETAGTKRHDRRLAQLR